MNGKGAMLPWRDGFNRFDVSVIVPTYNRGHYIEECLNSLINQTRPALEIIVVDDGSEDDTPTRLQRYGNKIRYIKKENGGKPTAVNLGLRLAKGNFIWIFDDDDVALPLAIERRLHTLKENPDAGFAYGPHFLGGDGPDGGIVRGRLHQTPHYSDERFFYELMKSCFFHLAGALVRIEAYQCVGDFDVELFSSEDYDIQIRITRAFKAAYCPYPSFVFRRHSGDRGAKGHRSRGDERSRVFQQYDSKIGLKLRSTLSLEEYLVPRIETVTTIEQTRLALLARMVVMASKACLAEMFDDLQAALNTLRPNQRLNRHETALIASAICTEYAYAACRTDWTSFMARLKQIAEHSAGKQAIRALAKGFLQLAKAYPGGIAERGRKLSLSFITWAAPYSFGRAQDTN